MVFPPPITAVNLKCLKLALRAFAKRSLKTLKNLKNRRIQPNLSALSSGMSPNSVKPRQGSGLDKGKVLKPVVPLQDAHSETSAWPFLGESCLDILP